MEYRERNFWLESVPQRKPSRPVPPDRADVVVVGAGFTGLSAARSLAAGGACVAVLEAETVGFGASSRNGGMVLPGLKLGAGALIQRYGIELAKRMFQASKDAIDWVEQIVAEEQIACGFHRHGHLSLAAKQKHFESTLRDAELLQRDFAHNVSVLRPQQLGEEIGSDSYFGGSLDLASAGVNPAQYVQGLACAAEKAGARIFEACPVQGLRRSQRNGSSGWEVAFASGSKLFAEKVLLAGGAYTPRSLPMIPRKIVPIGSFIIVTGVLSDELVHIVIPKGRMIYDSLNFLHYFRLTPDRRMLFGGRAAFFPAAPSTVRSSASILRREMTRIFPQLKDAAVEYVWGGTLDVTFDLMPHSGGSEGVYFVIGFAGHGVALASYLGSKLGTNMLRPEWDDPFGEIRFPGAPLPMYDGRPWFLPAVGAWFKFLDWVS